MSLRLVFVTILVLTFLMLSAWGLTLYLRAGRLNNWLTLEQINERVTADLPRGTALSKIDKYFSDNDVEHGYYEPANEVSAMIHSIWGGRLFVQKDAWIKIQLDQNQQLKDIKVEALLTGP